MKTLLAALVAASTLLVAAESRACNPVQAITSYQSAALVAPVVAPVTYQPVIAAVEVAPVNYAVPANLQLVAVNNHCSQRQSFKSQFKPGQPVRNMFRAIIPGR